MAKEHGKDQVYTLGELGGEHSDKATELFEQRTPKR